MKAERGRIKVGLIGYPVEHSLSPAMQNAAFAALGMEGCYSLLPTRPEDFSAQIERCVREGYTGWNITVPHKERMLPYLQSMAPEVEATGACNTVRVENGELVGYNTDITGFLKGLEEAGGIGDGSRTVVLGAGGSARAVVYALASAGHSVIILARNVGQAGGLAGSLSEVIKAHIEYGLLTADTINANVQDAALLVNCTPAGMWPHTDTTPLPDGTRLPGHLLVYDLVYRPRPSLLLEIATGGVCRTQDGLAMLIGQGAAAFKIWTGQAPPQNVMRDACLQELERRS
ncbi:MAG: shikimate dehydrogenase [Chloroflexia bacterium]